MNDDFINSLTADLKPVKTLDTGRLWALAGAIFGIMAFIVIVFYQVRPEFSSNILENVIKAPMVALKPAYFIGLGALGMLAVKGLSRPDGHVSASTLVGITLLVLGLFAGFVITMATAAAGEFAHQMAMTYVLCVCTIIGGGLTAWFALWSLWLRKTATQWPKILGAVSALACAGLIAGAYALHCAMDSPIYIMVFYFVPVAVVCAIGAALGPRLLRW